MITAAQIAEDIEKGIFVYKTYGTEEIVELLKGWVEEIIDECANRVTWHYGYTEDGTAGPVIDRDKIIMVKAML